MRIVKIISGGQTGADRAALDAAIACGVPHGGWCPKGRRSEDGSIPDGYNLRETESDIYPVRTKANVADSDLTLIFSRGPLAGGSLLTQDFAVKLNKPCLHIDLSKPCDLFQILETSFSHLGNAVVNVAGPRASNDPEIYTAVRECLEQVLVR